MKLYLRSLYRNVVAGTRLALFMPVRPYDYRAAPLDFTLLVAFNFLVWVAAAAIRTGVSGDFDETAIPIYLGSIPLVLVTAMLVAWIYADLFEMPLGDPALGLDAPDPFDAVTDIRRPARPSANSCEPIRDWRRRAWARTALLALVFYASIGR